MPKIRLSKNIFKLISFGKKLTLHFIIFCYQTMQTKILKNQAKKNEG